MFGINETGWGIFILFGLVFAFVLILAYLISTLIEHRYKDKTKLEGIKIVIYSAALFILLGVFDISPLISVLVVFGVVFLYLFWKLTTKLK